jgi:hypothetical protein
MSILQWPKELDVDGLHARVCRPERPRLTEAREALSGILDAREALECAVANGLCPMDWIDSPARAWGGKPHSPRKKPHAVATVIAMTSDARGILEAESLAREFLARAQVWTTIAPADNPIYWNEKSGPLRQRGVRPNARPAMPAELMSFATRAIPPSNLARVLAALAPPPSAEPQPPKRTGLRGLLDSALAAFRTTDAQRAPDHIPAWSRAANDAWRRGNELAPLQAIEDHWHAWQYAAIAHADLSLEEVYGREVPGIDPEIARTSLAELPNPIEPLAELWRTGYALHFANAKQLELHLPPLE